MTGHVNRQAVLRGLAEPSDVEYSVAQGRPKSRAGRRGKLSFEALVRVVDRKADGATNAFIATSLGLSVEYVRQFAHMATQGDVALLAAVRDGTVPLSVGLEISKLADSALRSELLESYHSGRIRGKRLISERILLSQRQQPTFSRLSARQTGDVHGDTEIDCPSLPAGARGRQQTALRKRQRLAELRNTFARLCEDPEFVALLGEQGFDKIPQLLLGRG